jgi:hypothetical protein
MTNGDDYRELQTKFESERGRFSVLPHRSWLLECLGRMAQHVFRPRYRHALLHHFRLHQSALIGVVKSSLDRATTGADNQPEPDAGVLS